MKKILLICALLFTAISATADEATEAQALLQKMHTASEKNNYIGTFVFQQAQDNQLMSSRITHSFSAGNENEKVERLDGRPHEYIRHNEDITSYQPDTKTLRHEKRQAQDIFPAVLAFNDANLAEHYRFKLAEVARVAGNECRMINVVPKDQLRYGYRLCAAVTSNLMLQAQTLDANNKVLEQIAFVSLTIGNVDENLIKPTYPNTKEWEVVRGTEAVSVTSGWVVKNMPDGFKKIREVRRLISPHTDAASTPAVAHKIKLHEVLQLVFSDGLATISVFVESTKTGNHHGVSHQGATTFFGRQQGDYWITFVGEVPLAAIKLMSDSIEYKMK